MPIPTDAAVLDALKMVRDPDFNRDIVDLKFVKDLRVDPSGRVAFTIELATPASSARGPMRELARDIVARVPGVTAVDVSISARVRPAISPEINKPPVEGVDFRRRANTCCV